jgi:hypothetical protein
MELGSYNKKSGQEKRIMKTQVVFTRELLSFRSFITIAEFVYGLVPQFHSVPGMFKLRMRI